MQLVPQRSSAQDTTQPIYTLLCRSTAQHPLTPETLETVRTDFLKRHPCDAGPNRITGLLLYADGHFLHYLEGSKQSLHTVQKTIANWPWHRNPQCQTLPPAPQRAYPTWTFTACADWSPVAQAHRWLDVG
jgi:hypothetical protein